jgi:hypothetical protein
MKAYGVVVVAAFAGCGWGGVKGSGKAAREVRTVGAFTAVEVSSALRVEISIAAEPRVEITGDDNLLPLITVELGKHGLEIRSRQGLQPSVPLVVHIKAPQLRSITASGASTVTVHDVRADALSVEVSGASTLRGDGSVHQLTAEVSGAADLALDLLPAERATVHVASAGSATINVSQALEAHVSGAAKLTYSGNPPDVKKDVSSAGSIVQR